MAETVVNRRKSQLFLNNIAPVKNTYHELVKNKLKGGKFISTKAGIIQIIGMLVLVFAVTFFVVQPLCQNTPNWYRYIFPISCSLNIFVQLVFFIIFSMGYTINRPGFWIYLDIASILTLSLNTVICSVISFIACQGSSIDKISQSCGIAGGVVLLISCGAIFLMFRYVEDDEIAGGNNQTTQQETDEDYVHPRKSVFA